MEFRKKECQKSRWDEIHPGDVFANNGDICIKVEKKATKDGLVFNAINLSDGGFYYIPKDEECEVFKDCYLAY